jgi:hypothetical protein
MLRPLSFDAKNLKLRLKGMLKEFLPSVFSLCLKKKAPQA